MNDVKLIANPILKHWICGLFNNKYFKTLYLLLKCLIRFDKDCFYKVKIIQYRQSLAKLKRLQEQTNHWVPHAGCWEQLKSNFRAT